MEDLQDRSPVETQSRSKEDGSGDGVTQGNPPIPSSIDNPLDNGDGDQVSKSPGNGNAVTFKNDQNFSSSPRQDSLHPRAFYRSEMQTTFSWTPANDSVIIEKIDWRGMHIDQPSDWQLIAGAELSKEEGTYNFTTPFFEVTRDSAVLRLDLLGDNVKLGKFLASNMVIQIRWKTDLADGSSTSGWFTVVENQAEATQWYTKTFASSDTDANKDEKENGTEKAEFEILTASSSPTKEALTTIAPQQTSTDYPPATSASASASGKSNSGELSTGVIVGIAVGAAAGFILFITAVFLLYRRHHRKRQAAEQAGYDSQQGGTVFFGDKETNRVPETPQTPYSEDGGQRLPMSDLTGVAITHDDGPQDQHRARNTNDANSTFVPYKNPEPATSRTDLAVRSGTATPLGLSSNIAVLVEDGMTEEEIRRLEEEERQLDDAIAQARRR